MTFLISTVLILIAAYILYAASSQPAYRFGKIGTVLRANTRIARLASALLVLSSGIMIFLGSGFAVAVFFVLTILMTALCCLLLFLPMIFKQPTGKTNAGK